MDVYRGNTTLEITYRDSIPVDSVVVFKDRQKITRKELAIFHSIYNDLKKLREE